MESSLQHIEDYFTGQLNDTDRRIFEQRCESDPEFAREVALYIGMRGAVRKAIHDSKKKDFESLLVNRDTAPGEKTIPVYVWISGVAASILIAVALFFYLDHPNPQQLANAYVEDHMSTISVTMGVEQDSLAMGVVAYNEGDFVRAEEIFSALLKYPSVEFSSTKYLGMVFLSTGKYDSALQYFDRLADIDGMYANPGKFYKAVTLMKRSQGNDVNEAKQILAEVVSGRMAGYKEAERWLHELD